MPTETFEQYLERTLADSGLRSYGHNTAANEAAEELCYQRAMECYGRVEPAPVPAPTPSQEEKKAIWAAGWPGPSFARPAPPVEVPYKAVGPIPRRAAPAHPVPSWGIHSPEVEDAPHGAALPEGKPSEGDDWHDRVFPTWGGTPHVAAAPEPVHCAVNATYSFDSAARGLVQHHLDRIQLHLTQIGHVLDAYRDK